MAADPADPVRQGGWSCSGAFTDLIVKLENNYIALKQRQLSGALQGYDERKGTFAEEVARTDGGACTQVLQRFLSFFDDGHVFVFERPEYAADELEAFRSEVQRDAMAVHELDVLLKQEGPSNGIIGKWGDGRSEFAIVKSDGQYRAYVLASSVEGVQAGELKAVLSPADEEFEGTYYSYGHAPRYVRAGLYKEGTLLLFGAGVLWGRLDSTYSREVEMIDASDPSRPTIKKLDDESTLLSIPSFLVDFRDFQAFLSGHDDTLSGTRNLVIDIRGNSGGNAIYFPLLALFANKTMPGGQGLVLASEDNLAYFQDQAKYSRIYKRVAKEIENNMGAIVDGPAYPKKTLKRAKTGIENVAILTDEGCMSAAESFILHARGVSDSVTTFGSPTAGVIDYTSVNILRLPSGSRNILFGYPTSTYHKNVPAEGYNESGIVPDVPIEHSVRDKVGFILEYLERPTKPRASKAGP